MSPKIGICASAHRPQNWMSLYNSIGKNDIEFELVFVGPNEPDYELPKNFRFIRSLVKPAQCVEIAMRNTTADLVMDIADDCFFITPQPLDRLYALYKSCNLEEIIVTPRGMMNGGVLPLSAQRLVADDGSIFVMPLCGLMSKKLYIDIGGIDKNFEAAFWSLDIAMRIYALGGRVVMSDVCINEDKGKMTRSNGIGESAVHDWPLLESLWTTNGKVQLNRKKPVEPFSDINILNASQGPRGRWRGNGFLLFEKIEDNILSQWSVAGRVIRAIGKPHMYPNYTKKIFLRLKGK